MDQVASAPHPSDTPPADAPIAAGLTQFTWHDGRLWRWRADDAGSALRVGLPDGERRVNADVLDGRAMLDAVTDLADDASDSARCLATLAEFAKNAVALEQFYPSARRRHDGVVASWRLLVGDPADVERIESFAASMPAACFCADEPFHATDRLELVESFLDACCDAIVRRSLAKDEFFAGVHERAADPVADAEVRWVSALVADPDEIVSEPTKTLVRGRDREVTELLDKVQTWTSRLGDAGGEPWRLGFLLEEPESGDEDGVWPLRWQLLPPLELSDHHVPLPAEQVWEQPAGSIGYVGRNAVRLRERLGAELKRAAEVLPPLADLLAEWPHRSGPSSLSLDGGDAFRVLRDHAEALSDAGFDVQLPGWANQKENRLEVVMDLQPAAGTEEAYAATGGALGLDALLTFNWKISVGGDAITMDEFRALVDRQVPLIRRGGRWIEVDPQAAIAAAEMIERRPPGTITLGEAFRAGFGLGEFRSSTGTSPAIRLEGTEWVDKLLEQAPDDAAKALPQPEQFTGELRPYQLRGLQWMAFLDRVGLGGVLADDMGLGKTIQLIALLLHERERADAANEANGPGTVQTKPTLLFVPTSVLGNWARELRRFAPRLKVLPHHGPARSRGEKFAEDAEKSDVVVTSYALSHRDQEDLRKVRWGRVALDEAQKIKNPQAASSIAVRSISAGRKIALTGTPVENHLGELWSIMDLLNPGLLGTQGEFRERFAIPIEKHGDRARGRRLREMIRPFVLRRTKDEPEVAADLPAKMEMSVFCGLTAEQAAIYERITSDMLGRIDTATGIRRRGLILSVLTKLKQVCDHPALLAEENVDKKNPDQAQVSINRSGKAQRLAEMLEEVIEEGQKALIFTQYRKMGDLLVPMLEKALKKPIVFLHGGTPQQKRDDMVQDFQNISTKDGGAPVFLLSLRAGGLGLNLTAASHVFHFDRWWNPAVENQATDRAHRIGQTRRVQVHKFVTLGTVEERIDKMLAEKSALAQNIVGSGDEWLTELSTGELREYLSLSRSDMTDDLDLDDEDDDELPSSADLANSEAA